MADTLNVGIIGAGWPGRMHAQALASTNPFKLRAVADLIPARRKALIKQFDLTQEYADAMDLINDRQIDVVSLCTPNDLHAPLAIAALRAGKHVLCESPPTISAREAGKIATAAKKSGKTLLYAMQRRFGAAEQAAHQVLAKGYLDEVTHIRISWTRTRAIPIGTGWFSDKPRSGGGALIDLGSQMLDLAWYLLGQPAPTSVYATAHQQFSHLAPAGISYNVEDSASALLKFQDNKTVELSCSWAINQPPGQNGTACRLYARKGALEVYTPRGPIVYRGFDGKSPVKASALKTPKVHGYAAMARHFRDCILGKSQPLIGPAQGITLMQMIDALYRSIETGRSVQLAAAQPAH